MTALSAQAKARVAAVLQTLPPAVVEQILDRSGVKAPLNAVVFNTERDGLACSRGLAASCQERAWRWIVTEIAPDAVTDVIVAVLANSGDGISAACERAFNAIAENLKARLATKEGRRAAAEYLGHPDAPKQLEDVATAYQCAHEVCGALLEERRLASLFDAMRTSPNDAALITLCAFARRAPNPRSLIDAVAATHRGRDAKQLDAGAFAPVFEHVFSGLAERCRLKAEQAEVEGDAAALEAAAEERVDRFLDVRRGLVERVRASVFVTLNRVLTSDAGRFTAACEAAAARIESDTAPAAATPSDDIEPLRVGAAARFLKAMTAHAASLGCERALLDAHAIVDAKINDGRLRAAAAEPGDGSVNVDAPAWQALVAIVAVWRDEASASQLERILRDASGKPDFSTVVMSVARPFIDLLERSKELGRIAAPSLSEVWDWARARAPDLQDAEEAFVAARDGAEAWSATRIVSRARARIVEVIEEGQDALQAVSRRAAADVAEIKLTLEHADRLESVFGRVDAGLAPWSEERASQFKALFDDVVAHDENSAPLLFVYAAMRYAQPTHALRALCRVTRTTSSILLERTEYVIVGDALLDQADGHANTFIAALSEWVDPSTLVEAVRAYGALADGFREELDLTRTGRWGSRYYKMLADRSRTLELLCDAAVKSLEDVTPRRAGRGASSPLTNAAPHEKAVARVVMLAEFLSGTGLVDQRAGFARARAIAVDTFGARLRAHIDMLIDLGLDGDSVAPEIATALIPVVEAWEGPEHAAILRRRIASIAAANSAAEDKEAS